MSSNVRTAIAAAAATLAGIVLSGPVSLLLVTLHPQPAWSGADAFVHAYHPVQAIPYFTGFLLVGGALSLIGALHALAGQELRARSAAALGFAAAFAALIILNYVIQTTFLPALVRGYAPENAALIAALSLANPRALGWAIEMWGYAVLGVATWLVAPVFSGDGRVGRITAALFVANGPVSVAGGVWTAARPGWVMTAAGLALFAAWNLLMLVMVALAIVVLRGRARAAGARPARPVARAEAP
jgi:hypothetical protein